MLRISTCGSGGGTNEPIHSLLVILLDTDNSYSEPSSPSSALIITGHLTLPLTNAQAPTPDSTYVLGDTGTPCDDEVAGEHAIPAVHQAFGVGPSGLPGVGDEGRKERAKLPLRKP